MLGDNVRNHALVEALKKTVRHGDTVIDIGSGTGFLAMIARGLGAGHCILIERDPDMAAVSRKLLLENNVKSCTVMEGDSRELKGLPKADIIISETLGNYAYEENIIEILNDAARFLKPKGHLIPSGLTQYVAPVTAKRFADELSVWRHVGHDLSFRSAEEISVNNIYVKDVQPNDLLEGDSAIREWDTIDFTKRNESVRKRHASWTPDGDGYVYGFSVWWDCLLAQGVRISTAPAAPQTHWKQIYLPLRTPIHLKTGDMLEVNITSDSRPEVKINVTWEAVHIRGNGKREAQMMNMMNGY